MIKKPDEYTSRSFTGIQPTFWIVACLSQLLQAASNLLRRTYLSRFLLDVLSDFFVALGESPKKVRLPIRPRAVGRQS